MLSYQHKYHVGNHADVLKHISWLSVIRYLNNKDKPYTLIDTHAGEGLYPLNSADNRETETGVKLLQSNKQLQEDVLAYQGILAYFAEQDVLPGSPAIAAELMRDQDQLHCIELHPQAIATLKRFAKHKTNIHCHQRDAFEGLKGLLPPKIKRGAILIDPPYEQIEEYEWVKKSINNGLDKWTNAQILIWIPLIANRSEKKAKAAQELIEFCRALENDTCIATLSVAEKNKAEGMYGSVVVAINPPWTYKATMQDALQAISPNLSAHWNVE